MPKLIMPRTGLTGIPATMTLTTVPPSEPDQPHPAATLSRASHLSGQSALCARLAQPVSNLVAR